MVGCRVLIDEQLYRAHGFGLGAVVSGGLQGVAQCIGDVWLMRRPVIIEPTPIETTSGSSMTPVSEAVMPRATRQ